MKKLHADGKTGKSLDFPSLQSAANAVIFAQLDYTAIPKRFSLAAREIWELQLRLERRNRRSVNACFSHPRFRAAYDFLLLREEAGEDLGGSGEWWTHFQSGDNAERDKLLESANHAPKKRRRRRRRPAKDNH